MVQNFEDIFDDVSEALLKDYAKLAGISLESSLLARITEKGITGLGPGNKNETNSFDKVLDQGQSHVENAKDAIAFLDQNVTKFIDEMNSLSSGKREGTKISENDIRRLTILAESNFEQDEATPGERTESNALGGGLNNLSTGDLGGSATYDPGSFELAAEQKQRLISLIGEDGDLGVALKKYVKGKNPTYNGLINVISKLPDQIKVVQERVDKVSTSSRNLFNQLVTVENSVRRLNELDANSDDYDEATLDNEYAKIIKSQLGVIESSSELLNNDEYVKSLDNLAKPGDFDRQQDRNSDEYRHARAYDVVVDNPRNLLRTPVGEGPDLSKLEIVEEVDVALEPGEQDRFVPAGAEEGLVQSRQVGVVDPVEVVSDPLVIEQQTALNIERAARGLPALVVDGLMGPATEAAIALSEGGYSQSEVDALLAVDTQDPVELDEMSPEVQKYIMENFGTVGYFSDRQDMMIPDPSGGGGEVNAYTYITDNQLTNLEQIRSLMSQTKWFNTKGEALKKFEQEWNDLGGSQLGDDAVSGSFSGATEAQKDLIDVEMDVIRREAKRLQLGLSEEDIWQLAFNAKSLGMDSYEVKEQFTKTYNAQLGEKDQGYFNDLRYQVSDEASKYMLDIGASDLNDMAEQLYLGNTTTEILESNFRTQAKNANPALASVIDQGYTPRMYFSPYKNQAEKLLGRPVDFMGADSGLFTKLAGSEVSGDGLQRPMTSSEFGRSVRGMAEWEFTDGARDEAYDAVSQITRMFGAVG